MAQAPPRRGRTAAAASLASTAQSQALLDSLARAQLNGHPRDLIRRRHARWRRETRGLVCGNFKSLESPAPATILLVSVSACACSQLARLLPSGRPSCSQMAKARSLMARSRSFGIVPHPPLVLLASDGSEFRCNIAAYGYAIVTAGRTTKAHGVM